MPSRRLKLGNLPDALGRSYGGLNVINDDSPKQKEDDNAPLFSFLAKDSVKRKQTKKGTNIEVYPLQKQIETKKSQSERCKLLSNTKRHGTRKKVKTNGISKSAMDWHVHYASQAPGPGSYAPKDIKGRRIGTVFLHSGQADRTIGGGGGGHDEGPGPQEYDAIAALDAVRPRKVGGYVSVTNPRTDEALKEYDGPPPYLIDKDPRYTPLAFSFGQPRITKTRFKEPEPEAGPGDYNVLKRRPHTAGGRFSKAEQSYFDSKEFRDKADEPGPGDYEVIFAGDKKPDCVGKISKHKPKSLDEKLLADARETPGPGLYNTDPGFHTPAARFGKSGAKSALDWIIYYAEKNQSEHMGGLVKPPRIYGGRFSTSRKVNMTEVEEKRARTIPGPTDYILPSTLIIPGGTWGKAVDRKEESHDKDQGPGPGDYDVCGSLDKVRPRVLGGPIAHLGGTLWRREATDAKAKIPGPSDYYGATAALDHTSTAKLPRDISLGKPPQSGFKGQKYFRVAKILSAKEISVDSNHPELNYQKLYLDVGNNITLTTLTTAPNITHDSHGKCLIVALPGAIVNGNREVKKRKEFGVEIGAVVMNIFTEKMQWSYQGHRALFIPNSFEPGEFAPLSFVPGPLDYDTVTALDAVKRRQGIGCKLSTSVKAHYILKKFKFKTVGELTRVNEKQFMVLTKDQELSSMLQEIDRSAVKLDKDELYVRRSIRAALHLAYARIENAKEGGPGQYKVPNTVRGTEGCPFPGGRVYPDRNLFLSWQEAATNGDGDVELV